MSTTLDQPTIQQRASAATLRLRQNLGIDNLKLLSAAVAEAAAAELGKNADFRMQVRKIYDELAAMGTRQPARRRTPSQPKTQLIPLPGTEGTRFDPFAPLDPYSLLRLYGPHQLRAALNEHSYSALRGAASAVQQKNPGSKPRDGRKSDALVNYIVEQLAPGN